MEATHFKIVPPLPPCLTLLAALRRPKSQTPNTVAGQIYLRSVVGGQGVANIELGGRGASGATPLDNHKAQARRPRSIFQIGLVVVQSCFHQQSLDAWSSIAPNKLNAPQIEPRRGLVEPMRPQPHGRRGFEHRALGAQTRCADYVLKPSRRFNFCRRIPG